MIVAGRDYTIEVHRRSVIPAPVAIVIPQHETIALTRLAVDAIRAFTPSGLADLWVVDNTSSDWVREELATLNVSLILNRTPVHRWYQAPAQVGSLANAVALELAVHVLSAGTPRWAFFCHNDSLPIKRGWLEFLCRQDKVMVGCKASQRNGYPHSSGVLFDFGFLRRLGPGVLLPHLPEYDTAEGPARFTDHWSAWGLTHTVDACRLTDCPLDAGRGEGWLIHEDAEVSWDDTGHVFFVHKGGGSINGQDMSGWIQRARKELGL